MEAIVEKLFYFRSLLLFPAAVLFLVVAVFFSIKTRFIQFRAFGKFISLLTGHIGKEKDEKLKTINPFHALFTSMSTTIGMGNVIAPPLAIVIGGPGALFWLLIYNFFASATKYAEVTFAVKFRTKTRDGHIIGGPAEYLKVFSKFVANWYGLITIFLFTAWSALQANTLGEIFSENGVPTWVTGITLSVFIFIVLIGGAKRVGAISSKLVPLMFVIYMVCSLFILFKSPGLFFAAIKLIAKHVWTKTAPVGGFLGASVYVALREGVSKGVYVTECGVGTASIAHAMADVKKPTDQGILALYSVAADACLCAVSGILVVSTGVWKLGKFTNMLMFRVFDQSIPVFGYFILLGTIFLFILTTLIGNSFNGSQSYASFTKHKWMNAYSFFVVAAIFFGAVLDVRLMWTITDLMVFLIAIPHLIGIVFIACYNPDILKFKNK